MSLLETTVTTVLQANPERLWGFWIEVPERGSQTTVFVDEDAARPIKIVGWVLSRDSPAIAVEVIVEGKVMSRAPINVRRPDIADAYPHVPVAVESGFRTTVNMQSAAELELLLQAVLEDENRIPLGRIRIWRRPLRSDFEPRLQPLMLTTLGRTGSTWIIRLLSQHPQIVAYRPFQYEPRVASYWMQILKTLSEPASYLQPITGDDKTSELWWLGHKASSDAGQLHDPQLRQWLGQNNTKALATFCQGRIEAFYGQVAMAQGRAEPIYFAEKYLPDDLSAAMVWQLYSQGREVFLVRDPRDMLASILAFNAKRGYAAFGRERAANNEAYARQMRASALSLLRSWEQRSDKAYLLRYEDAILRPVETLGSLLEYLALDLTPSAIKSMLRRASEEIPEMRKHRTIPEPERSIGRWRRDLDASVQAACHEAFGDILEKFGYTEGYTEK